MAAIVLLALPARVQGQTDTPRFTLAGTAGVTIGDASGSTYGGELSARLSRVFDITIAAVRLSDLTTDDLVTAAGTIAGLVGADADAHASANVFEGGVRLRWPTSSALRPYAVVGGGVARVTVETTFMRGGVQTAPGALGISIGPDLDGASTFGLGLLGAGVDVAASKHVVIDGGVRYTAIVSSRSETPRFVVFPVLRAQIGVGIRF